MIHDLDESIRNLFERDVLNGSGVDLEFDAPTKEWVGQLNKPTIDIFNAMDLDVSAVGNHELDQGYDDLVDRVMAPYDATTNPTGGAMWQYIAANIDEPGDADEIAPTWTKDVAGVTVGFVGAVTEHLPELVSPGGIEGLTVTDIVDATNEQALLALGEREARHLGVDTERLRRIVMAVSALVVGAAVAVASVVTLLVERRWVASIIDGFLQGAAATKA